MFVSFERLTAGKLMQFQRQRNNRASGAVHFAGKLGRGCGVAANFIKTFQAAAHQPAQSLIGQSYGCGVGQNMEGANHCRGLAGRFDDPAGQRRAIRHLHVQHVQIKPGKQRADST